MRPLLLACALVLILVAPPAEALAQAGEAQTVPWNDWRMWSAIAAFLGFTFGTLIKFGFDLWLDRIRERKERVFLAHVIQAEMTSLAAHATNSLVMARELQAAAEAEADLPTVGEVLSLDLVSAPFVYQAGVRLGLLGQTNTVEIFRALRNVAHFRRNIEAIGRRDLADLVPSDVLDQLVKEHTLKRRDNGLKLLSLHTLSTWLSA